MVLKADWAAAQVAKKIISSCKFLKHIQTRFKKIVVVDTQFQSDVSETYCTKALCAVYKDLSTGQVLKIWDHKQNNLLGNFP